MPPSGKGFLSFTTMRDKNQPQPLAVVVPLLMTSSHPPQTLPLPWKIWPPFAEIGFNGKDFFIPLVSSKTPSDLNFNSHRSAFVCVPVWPWLLWPGEVLVRLWGAEAWLAPRVCLFPAGVQLRNRQLQAGLRRTPVSRQLCQLLDQLCGTKTSWPHPAWFALKSSSMKYQLGLWGLGGGRGVTPMGARDQWTECKYCKVHLY